MLTNYSVVVVLRCQNGIDGTKNFVGIRVISFRSNEFIHLNANVSGLFICVFICYPVGSVHRKAEGGQGIVNCGSLTSAVHI